MGSQCRDKKSNWKVREFPGSPVVRTLCSHCQSSIPGQGTEILWATQQRGRKKTKNPESQSELSPRNFVFTNKKEEVGRHCGVWKWVIWCGPSAACGRDSNQVIEVSCTLHPGSQSVPIRSHFTDKETDVYWDTIFPESHSGPHVSPQKDLRIREKSGCPQLFRVLWKRERWSGNASEP